MSALEIAERSGMQVATMYASLVLGRLALAAGDGSSAFDYARRASTLRQRLGGLYAASAVDDLLAETAGHGPPDRA
jgi:hypothetical protein